MAHYAKPSSEFLAKYARLVERSEAFIKLKISQTIIILKTKRQKKVVSHNFFFFANVRDDCDKYICYYCLGNDRLRKTIYEKNYSS